MSEYIPKNIPDLIATATIITYPFWLWFVIVKQKIPWYLAWLIAIFYAGGFFAIFLKFAFQIIVFLIPCCIIKWLFDKLKH